MESNWTDEQMAADKELTRQKHLLSIDYADFESRHIEGMTKEGAHHFRTPLFTPVDSGLVMGGNPVGDAPRTVKTIVNLYPYEPYGIHPGQTLVQHQMDDSHDVQSPETIHRLADIVNISRQYGTVLVHCQAGLNRSGLICALAMYKSQKYNSMEAVIAHLRARRCTAVLCNKAFEEWLLGQDRRIVLPT